MRRVEVDPNQGCELGRDVSAARIQVECDVCQLTLLREMSRCPLRTFGKRSCNLEPLQERYSLIHCVMGYVKKSKEIESPSSAQRE
jgi:hypothetical protein